MEYHYTHRIQRHSAEEFPLDLFIYDEMAVKNVTRDLRRLSLGEKGLVELFQHPVSEGVFHSDESLRDIQNFLVLEAGEYQFHKSDYRSLAHHGVLSPGISSIQFLGSNSLKRAVNILTQGLFFVLPSGDFFDSRGNPIINGRRFSPSGQGTTYDKNGFLVCPVVQS
jgi:hypothetical protein